MVATSGVEHIRGVLRAAGQEHLLTFYDQLEPQEQKDLLQQLRNIDFEYSRESFEACMGDSTPKSPTVLEADRLEPIDPTHAVDVTTMATAEYEKYWDLGLKAIRAGRVGALLLAGGQGTRLGVPYPKGMYDVGMCSRSTLYEYQAKRIRRLQKIAGEGSVIYWYIMTSEATGPETVSFMENNKWFGLDPTQVVVFEQGLLPCFTFTGQMMLSDRGRVALAPDGNGGLYKALLKSGALAHMRTHGVELLHAYCVDNILVRVADPAFIGYCQEKRADCAAKCVPKTDPHEAVGVVCQVRGIGPQVVEYSEIGTQMAEQREPDGSLTYRAGNIANHFFTREFLERVTGSDEEKLVYHVAKKKIPYVSDSGEVTKPDKPNGVKLEKFVFDVFPFSKNFYTFTVSREDEFSPLKNAPSAGVDCPATAKAALSNLNLRALRAAGATVEPGGEPQANGHSTSGGDSPTTADGGIVVDINPLLWYPGEDPKVLNVAGKTFTSPVNLE